MRHNPSLRLPWFAPGKRIEGAIDSALYQFVTYSFTRLPCLAEPTLLAAVRNPC